MWTEKKLQQLKAEGKIKAYKSATQRKPKHLQLPAKPSKEKTWLSWNLQYWANDHALTLSTEFFFDKPRQWRFDWAFEALKISIEYEGLFAEKSRHTTVKGFTGDTDKYNRAQALGWRVIRVTALNYKTVLQTLNDYVAQNVHR